MITLLILIVFILNMGSLVYIFISGYTPEYLIGYGIPLATLCGLSLIALVLSAALTSKNK